MITENVYIVRCNGCLVYAAYRKNDAEEYIDARFRDALEQVLYEWEIDDPDEDELNRASLSVTFNGDFHEMDEVNLEGLSDEDEVVLKDGKQVRAVQIRRLLVGK